MRSLIPALLATCLAVACGSRQPPPDEPVQHRQDPWANTRPEADDSTGRPQLGVVVQAMTGDLRTYFGAPPDRGVLVAHVAPGSAADRSGLRVGDVIVFADGHVVQTSDDLREAVSGHGPGMMRLESIRRGAPVQTQVLIAEQPPASPLM